MPKNTAALHLSLASILIFLLSALLIVVLVLKKLQSILKLLSNTMTLFNLRVFYVHLSRAFIKSQYITSTACSSITSFHRSRTFLSCNTVVHPGIKPYCLSLNKLYCYKSVFVAASQICT